MKGSDNLLYGLTFQGGSHTYSTIIKIKNDGTGFGVLSNFSTYGFDLYGDLVQGSDGFLCGMTSNGGEYNNGAIFKSYYNGTGFTLLRSFNFSDGSSPQGSLVEGQDGAFYGMTFQGGDNNNGIIFKINADSSGFTSLRSLTSATDGASPFGNLIQASDDAFYGLTSAGGDNSLATIFKFTGDASYFTVLRSFSNASTDGRNPHGSLAQGSNGTFYGMATNGGTNDNGTIFNFTGDGSDFSLLKSLYLPTDGTNPNGSLVIQPSPLAFAQSISTDEDIPLAITLSGKGTAPITYTVVTAPLHGSLSGTAPNLTYKPAANYACSDAFSFRTYYALNTQTSPPTTVSLTVNPINDAPVLNLADKSVRELYLLS